MPDSEPMVIAKENYKSKELKKALFAEVRDMIRVLEEADSSYGPYSDEQIANVIFSVFNSKLDEFTLIFLPTFQTTKS